MTQAVIAIVDDDPALLELTQAILTEDGYQVVIWSEGKTAYEFVRDQRPDLLMVDLRMEHPQAGWIIIHMLRLDPQTADLPILVCTADVTYVQMRRQLLREQRCAVLLKPFDADELLAQVTRLLHAPAADQSNLNDAGNPPSDQGQTRWWKPWRIHAKRLSQFPSVWRRR